MIVLRIIQSITLILMVVWPINPERLWQSRATFDISFVYNSLFHGANLLGQLSHVEAVLQEIDVWRHHAVLTFLVVTVLLGTFWERWFVVDVCGQVHGVFWVPAARRLQVRHLCLGYSMDWLRDVAVASHANTAGLRLIMTQISITEERVVVLLKILLLLLSVIWAENVGQVDYGSILVDTGQLQLVISQIVIWLESNELFGTRILTSLRLIFIQRNGVSS